MKEKSKEGLLRFRRKGDLAGRKLIEYIPTMMITNLSTLLLVSVDGVVAGNLVGREALSAVNVFYPVTVLVGAISSLVAVGISTSISNAMGRNDAAELDHIKGASIHITIAMAIIASIVQIPIVFGMVRSYGLPEEMYRMTMQYAIGIMICTPLGLISTVGTYEMQIAGKMKMLMRLSVIEGVSNVVFDLLYMGVFKMGVAGAGFGTATANLIRCSLTVIVLLRYTDMLKSDTKTISLSDAKKILSAGVPEAAYMLVIALQNYMMMMILLDAFGTDGGVIKGVCSLCFNIANVVLSGNMSSVRPLMGLYAGADDKEGLQLLVLQGAVLNLGGVGLITLITEIWPEWFYAMNGVDDIPDGGLLCVRLYALVFVFKGFDSLFRMYLSNRKDSRFTTRLTVAGNVILPLFAFILWKTAPTPFIFLAYLFVEVLIFAISYFRYCMWIEKDREEIEENGEDIQLYMTVRPDEAVEASRDLRNFAEEHGINRKIANRTALCMEEMVAYVKAAEATDQEKRDAVRKNPKAGEDDDLYYKGSSVEVTVRFKGKDSVVFVTMDDGKCIALDKDENKRKLITDNYGLLKKLAKSVEYQYILNMNYTRLTFDEN